MRTLLGWILSLCALTACGGGNDNHTDGPKVNPEPNKTGQVESATPDAPLGSAIDATLIYHVAGPIIAHDNGSKIPNPWDSYRAHFATHCASCHGENGPHPRLDTDPSRDGEESYFMNMTASRVGLDVAMPRTVPYDTDHQTDNAEIWRPVAKWAEYVNAPKCNTPTATPQAPAPKFGLAQWTSDSNGAASSVWQNMTQKTEDSFTIGLGTLQVGSKVSAHIRLFDANHVELADLVLKPTLVNGQGNVVLAADDVVGGAQIDTPRTASVSLSCRE